MTSDVRTDREAVEKLVIRLMEADTPYTPLLLPDGWGSAPDDTLHPAAWRTLEALQAENERLEGKIERVIDEAAGLADGADEAAFIERRLRAALGKGGSDDQ